MIPKVPYHILLLIILISTTTSAIPTLIKEINVNNESKQRELVTDSDYDCVYMIYIRTGSIWKGGTDSVISLTLIGSDGSGVAITDIEAWGGLMGKDHDYFERGNLDIFSGRGPCLSSPVCWMNLSSDGTGPHHGWYCNYVEVTTTGPHVPCEQQLFTVEQWLARDASPYQLYATRDNCAAPEAAADDRLEPRSRHAPRRVAV
ncbi:PLAT domain-containing protein 3-like [Dioscorea cayenensis subsp. rotundata]|uniref:PLAT domain-containing protein 3-like n=1 Tax=Dioscorea cayennensis subsp. rotundata TaxID=55577 RepID=A0AB40BDZ3_DIOCR|nr:PLAT domain-containing protein 3-like [Dioscorea cayenensis subsp. rotundata]